MQHLSHLNVRCVINAIAQPRLSPVVLWLLVLYYYLHRVRRKYSYQYLN